MPVLQKIYHILKAISDRVEKIVEVLSAIMVFACFCSVLLQVINRYIMVKQTLIPWTSISWTDELSRFLLIGIAYCALGMCYRHGQLSRADMIYSKLKPAPKKILYTLETTGIMVFVGYTIYYGIQFARVNSIYHSDMLRIPGNILYMIPVIGMLLIGFEVLVEFFGVISNQLTPFECVVPSDNDIDCSV